MRSTVSPLPLNLDDSLDGILQLLKGEIAEIKFVCWTLGAGVGDLYLDLLSLIRDQSTLVTLGWHKLRIGSSYVRIGGNEAAAALVVIP